MNIYAIFNSKSILMWGSFNAQSVLMASNIIIFVLSVCKFSFAKAEQQKVNKHQKFYNNFNIQHQLEHFEYEMNWTLDNFKSINRRYLHGFSKINFVKSQTFFFRQKNVKIKNSSCPQWRLELIFEQKLSFMVNQNKFKLGIHRSVREFSGFILFQIVLI